MTQYPEKVVLRTNAFLTSTLIGRSLYVLPLEWWYLEFDRSNLYFMCTEELSDITGEPLNEVSVNFLGLPRYDNFSAVVAKGAYNVGGHRGYDKATGWDTVNAEHEQDGDGTRKLSHKKQKHKKGETKVEEQQAADSTHENAINTGGVPLSAEVHQEFHDFVGPYNERLFALTGRRCNWEM
uniref:Uncharacterized protein n=1 Tax=Craspedostauros australis TaxID=1486917 RepID=A0A7R9ZM67_9STRA